MSGSYNGGDSFKPANPYGSKGGAYSGQQNNFNSKTAPTYYAAANKPSQPIVQVSAPAGPVQTVTLASGNQAAVGTYTGSNPGSSFTVNPDGTVTNHDPGFLNIQKELGSDSIAGGIIRKTIEQYAGNLIGAGGKDLGIGPGTPASNPDAYAPNPWQTIQGYGVGVTGGALTGNIQSWLNGYNSVFGIPGPAPLTPTGATARTDATGAILNLLGQAEGTDRGRGYNEVIGYGQFGNPGTDLTNMTLSDVYAYQDTLKANGAPSTAVGRYQFINSTLRSTANRLGYDPNTTKFTPEVQDALATQRLNDRGYQSYQSGTLSQKDFMSNISQEWASLPDPYNDNKSHYGQHLGASPDQVVGALG